jgi:hypothetical protein
VPGGLALSESEKAVALADSPEAQFQPVDNASDPAFTEVAEEPMGPYEYSPASEPTVTTPLEVLQAIEGLKVGKAPGANGIPKRVLRHLPKHAITFLTKVFDAVLRRQYFPTVWKHARAVPILKPGKDPTLPSSYRPICLLDNIRKLFERILLSRDLLEVNERGMLRDEQFDF